MAKDEANKKPKKVSTKVKVIILKTELTKFGLKADATGREASTRIREKLGLPVLQASRSSRKSELIEKLGLPADAKTADIQKAMLERLA